MAGFASIWIRLFCIVICLSVALSCSKPSNGRGHFKESIKIEPISFDMEYSEIQDLISTSETDQYRDYSKSYAVVEYTKYARSFDEFMETFPSGTIETYMRASEFEFGDSREEKFGALPFNTKIFNDSKFSHLYEFVMHENLPYHYNVWAKIGFKCRRNSKKLYLKPFIDGSITSEDGIERFLRFGIAAGNITFIPKSEE